MSICVYIYTYTHTHTGYSNLYIAAEKGHTSVVKALVNAEGSLPLLMLTNSNGIYVYVYTYSVCICTHVYMYVCSNKCVR